MPSSPSSFGRQVSSHETLMPPTPKSGPFHRNCLRICSIRYKSDFRSMNTLAQKTWIAWSTDLTSYRRPAKDKNRWDQDWALVVIELINEIQFTLQSFEAIMGTPRYRIGRVPSRKSREERSCWWSSFEPSAQKISFLDILGLSPDQLENLSIPVFSSSIETRLVSANKSTSSVKKRWESRVTLHLQ